MIGRISGTLVEKHPPQVVVVSHGVGYEIDVPMSTFYQLPRTGESVELLTHLVVREDAHLLYGFLTAAERLVLELRDKLPVAVRAMHSAEPPSARSDAVDALLALGYNEREAQAAVKQLPADLQLADAIRQALKHLAKT